MDTAITGIVWPTGASDFSINPRRKGNGVKQIREAFQANLVLLGWKVEQAAVASVGPVDAVLETDIGIFAVEWETGNISSSHRSLNRLTLGFMDGKLVGGILILPSRELYSYLTDRVGNYTEIQPYFVIYERLDLSRCVFAVIEVEHDRIDPNAPLIVKATDGWALVKRQR